MRVTEEGSAVRSTACAQRLGIRLRLSPLSARSMRAHLHGDAKSCSCDLCVVFHRERKTA